MEKSPFPEDNVHDWELAISLPNEENQKVINEYLCSLKNANKSKRSLICFRSLLHLFFIERVNFFSTVTSNDTKLWLIEHERTEKKHNYLSAVTPPFFLQLLYRGRLFRQKSISVSVGKGRQILGGKNHLIQ